MASLLHEPQVIMRYTVFFGSMLLWAAAMVSAQVPVHPSLLRNHPKIDYAHGTVTDAVWQLELRLRSGEVKLDFDERNGYLPAVLKALDVPIASQVLVFSKTSFQAPRINPGNPRALYFSDTTAVGWVRGGEVLEFVAQDPKQGAIFYTMRNSPQETPTLARNDTCVMCHASDATQNVPGMFVGSVFPGRDGTTMYGPAYTTDHRSPLMIRWGGWYVTGAHRADRHMGNAIVTDPTDLAAMVTPETLHVDSLAGKFDPAGYLSPHSDIVALLTLEHQATMLNLLTKLAWDARIGADASRPLDRAAAEVVDYMLFVDEAPLPGVVRGMSTFAEVYAARGPRDRRGRSLRDFDLTSRLLRYPCSPLIYSEQFDALPDTAKAAVYARLWEILSGAEHGPRYAALSAADRQAILEILRETKPGLPKVFL
jgi:hypothetical protein